ncbi:uncharacterized protein I206_106384 [Kwoniella pini CBS 10737]|uniref:Transmembrane protein 188 n=1 Tax=Kwoniella pini CBS 10737 TaxID=1296096 RepID=A0A1B9HU63_9TREE|nr:uncharacterized protein I206_07187 [Kwoniella pini CBS 10737]OCF46800.1 hypothetical protein I206_07187 [Kwoniella pini CBS 10737]
MSSRMSPTTSSSGTSTPTRPHPLAPYHPPADTATYRDLLLFEERLKSNAEMLKKRRQRYNVFLYTFIIALAFMAYKLFITPPNSNLKIRALQASMAVVSVTLVLFFASGMYEEKIKYAHSYINHSNKALRPLNMHLNMRRSKPSLLSYIPYIRHFRSASPPVSSTPPLQSNPQTTTKPFLGGKGGVVNHGAGRKVSSSTNVMATIPPSTNPRGELIFSSRVDRTFREGYERYRSAFERRREEKQKEESKINLNSTQWLSWTTSSHKKGSGKSGRRNGSPSPSPIPSNGGYTPNPTPPISRKQTPPPGVGLGVETGMMGGRRRSPSPGASGLRNSLNLEKEGRERSESYSFVLDQNQGRQRMATAG